MTNGFPSSVYVCLPEDIRGCWGASHAEKTADKHHNRFRTVSTYIVEHKIIDSIKTRIYRELTAAATIADEIHLPGLADEFRCLLRPLENDREVG